jgi:hypothetical protein
VFSGHGSLENDGLNITFQNSLNGIQFSIDNASVVFTTRNVLSGNHSDLGGACIGVSGAGPFEAQPEPSLAGSWSGTISGGLGSSTVTATITEGDVDSTGFPTVSGSVTFAGTVCFTKGTLTGHQEGPWLYGTVATDDGSIAPSFLGSIDSTGQIVLDFIIDGGPCTGEGGGGQLVRQ